MAHGRGELVHHRFDLAADQVGEGRSTSLVRHMQQLQVRLPHEELYREVIGGAVAGRGNADLAGPRSSQSEIFMKRGNRRLWRHRQNDRHGLDRSDGHEVLQRIVGEVFEHRRAGGHRAARAEEQRIAVCRRLDHRGGADGAAGAGAVLHDHLLPERIRERRRDGARGDVDVAARRPGYNDAYRADGEVLGEPRHAKDPQAKERQDAFLHARTPLPAGRMKGYIDRMSKAKVTDLKKHYPDLAPDKDYPPLKFKSLKGRVSAAEWEAR